jgi:hypothetical protein
MAKRRKKNERIYKYECTITGEKFKLTEKAENQDELVSIKAYYELNPDEDDRPAVIKKQLELEAQNTFNKDDLFGEANDQ